MAPTKASWRAQRGCERLWCTTGIRAVKAWDGHGPCCTASSSLTSPPQPPPPPPCTHLEGHGDDAHVRGGE